MHYKIFLTYSFTTWRLKYFCIGSADWRSRWQLTREFWLDSSARTFGSAAELSSRWNKMRWRLAGDRSSLPVYAAAPCRHGGPSLCRRPTATILSTIALVSQCSSSLILQ